MRKHIISLGKKILGWPQSKPHIIFALRRVGLYTPARKLFFLIKPSDTRLITEELGHLAVRELMQEIQAELDQVSTENSVVFFKKT